MSKHAKQFFNITIPSCVAVCTLIFALVSMNKGNGSTIQILLTLSIVSFVHASFSRLSERIEKMETKLTNCQDEYAGKDNG